MSWKFCQELDDFLSNEWIKVVDICAIFAGWIPISEYIPDYSSDPKYSPRSYLRLEDGKRVTPGKEGFKEIILVLKSLYLLLTLLVRERAGLYLEIELE